MRTELRRNEAAVDSDLAVLPCIEQHLLLTGPLPNPLSRSRTQRFSPTNNILMVARLTARAPTSPAGWWTRPLKPRRTSPWGRACVDIRSINDPGYKIGDDWMRGAGMPCRRCGFETVLDNNAGTFRAGISLSQIAFYCGCTTTSFRPVHADKRGVHARRVCYHLHSFSAAHVRSPITMGRPLLAGATATMGFVDEQVRRH
jgi:uncharacterized protein (TIGR03790 family)